MLNFEFQNPTKIVFGKDSIKSLKELIKGSKKVLLIYGGGSIKKFGTYQKVMDQLVDVDVVEFGGVEPNPRYETLMKAVELGKKEGVDFLLGVGGGSVMDGTKFINIAMNFDGEDKLDILKGNYSIDRVHKMGMVLTLPATGSEMNCGGVISHGESKLGVKNELCYPIFSILDPEVTYSLPRVQVANGIVDTFVHVAEQYFTYPVGGLIQDRFAEGILQTLLDIADRTLDNPTDYEARANLVWCSTLALNGLIGKGVPQDWTTHGIGHELTALYGIDHGQTLAILLPAVLDVRREQKKAKIVQYGKRVLGIETGDIDQIIAKTREFFEGLGVKTRLSEYGVKREEIERIVENLKKNYRTNLSETGEVTPEVSREILNKSF